MTHLTYTALRIKQNLVCLLRKIFPGIFESYFKYRDCRFRQDHAGTHFSLPVDRKRTLSRHTCHVSGSFFLGLRVVCQPDRLSCILNKHVRTHFMFQRIDPGFSCFQRIQSRLHIVGSFPLARCRKHISIDPHRDIQFPAYFKKLRQILSVGFRQTAAELPGIPPPALHSNL